jgi:hypothetical protein
MIDISNDMTDAFYADPEIKKGKILIFNFEGSETHLKIVRLNRRKKTCFVEEYKLTEALTAKEAERAMNERH